jgi:hypothetical protein
MFLLLVVLLATLAGAVLVTPHQSSSDPSTPSMALHTSGCSILDAGGSVVYLRGLGVQATSNPPQACGPVKETPFLVGTRSDSQYLLICLLWMPPFSVTKTFGTST